MRDDSERQGQQRGDNTRNHAAKYALLLFSDHLRHPSIHNGLRPYWIGGLGFFNDIPLDVIMKRVND